MDLGELKKASQVASDAECPQCSRRTIQTRIEEDRFKYGTGDSAVELVAKIPVRTCSSCGFEFTDWEAEDLRHEAVCRHLGVMAPKQILGIRLMYDLSRSEFAAITKFGETSLSRWETGSVIQNLANDQLLYLLQFPENLQRLRERLAQGETHLVAGSILRPVQRKFVTDVEQHRERAGSFRLHKVVA